MGKLRIINIVLILLIFIGIVYGVVGTVTSFKSHGNPFNITFIEKQNITRFIK